MEDIFSPSVAAQDPLKRASQEAQRLGRDVKEGLEDAASRGRSIADDAMRSAKDLAQEGRSAIAERAREAAAEARRRASRAAARGCCDRYSTTWSARTRMDCGIAMPSVRAVFRLSASSNVVGNRTGRSPGFAPLRIWPT